MGRIVVVYLTCLCAGFAWSRGLIWVADNCGLWPSAAYLAATLLVALGLFAFSLAARNR